MECDLNEEHVEPDLLLANDSDLEEDDAFYDTVEEEEEEEESDHDDDLPPVEDAVYDEHGFLIDEDNDMGMEEEQDDFWDILHELCKLWLLIEINHKVSKTASNEFWKLANKYFHRMYVAKENQRKNDWKNQLER